MVSLGLLGNCSRMVLLNVFLMYLAYPYSQHSEFLGHAEPNRLQSDRANGCSRTWCFLSLVFRTVLKAEFSQACHPAQQGTVSVCFALCTKALNQTSTFMPSIKSLSIPCFLVVIEHQMRHWFFFSLSFSLVVNSFVLSDSGFFVIKLFLKG